MYANTLIDPNTYKNKNTQCKKIYKFLTFQDMYINKIIPLYRCLKMFCSHHIPAHSSYQRHFLDVKWVGLLSL